MNEDLSEIIGARCTFSSKKIDADFVPKKDFYYGWAVKGDTIVLRISDYLEGAPEEVLSDFGDMMVRRALDMIWIEPLSFTDYVRSEEYIVSRRPVFIRRSKNLLRTDVGKCRVLSDSVQRLLERELLYPEDIENSYISWTRKDSHRRMGFCGTMFRVVGISSVLDTCSVSDDTIDYVVYHECLHLRQGYRSFGRIHDSEFRNWERRYPNWKECESALRSISARGFYGKEVRISRSRRTGGVHH